MSGDSRRGWSKGLLRENSGESGSLPVDASAPGPGSWAVGKLWMVFDGWASPKACFEERLRVNVCKGDEDWWQRCEGRGCFIIIFVFSAASSNIMIEA